MGSSQRRGASALATALALLALACAPRVARCAPGASALTPAARAAASPASGPAPAAVVHDGHQLSEALPLLAAPGPPIIIQIADNISWADVAAPRPVVVARDVTLRGVGVPEATEINLHGQYNAWRLEPGASLTLQNLTFSNLAVRPPSADPPPPTNASVFTFPLWFFQTDRSKEQLILDHVRLVIPYDEFLVIHHILVEWELRNPNSPVDMYTYFEDLIRENMRGLKCNCEGMLYAPRGEVHIVYAAGMGIVMKEVDMQYKRNTFDILTPRSNISASNPVFSGSFPEYPTIAPAVPAGSLPGWAVGVIVVGAVLFVILTLIAVAGPRRLALCLLGDRAGAGGSAPAGGGKGVSRGPSGYFADDGGGGGGGGDALGPRTASHKSGYGPGGLLTVLLPTGDSSGDRGGGGADGAMEEGLAPPPQGRRSISKSAAGRSANGLAMQTPRSYSSSAGGNAGPPPPARDTALDQLHAAVAQLNQEINDKSLIIHEVLGQGAYGTVYRGTWRNLPVAVKTVVFQDRATGGDKAQKRAITEAAITSSISHPNVVATLSYDLQPLHSPGAQMTTGNINLHSPQGLAAVTDWKLFLVQEFCNGGSLRQAVDGKSIYWDPDLHQPRLREILSTALDVACGMEHLHSKSIVHGDLTPNNVLLNTELVRSPSEGPGALALGGERPPSAAAGGGAPAASERGVSAGRLSVDVRALGSAGLTNVVRTAKIADFGLSIKMPEGASHVSNMRQGTPFYVAPEVLRRGNMTKASDVYSFGVLLWEMYHSKPPYKRSGRQGFVLRRGFPFFPEAAPPRYVQLATACMAQMPRARPPFSQIKAEVLELLNAPTDVLAAIPNAGPLGPPLGGAGRGAPAPAGLTADAVYQASPFWAPAGAAPAPPQQPPQQPPPPPAAFAAPVTSAGGEGPMGGAAGVLAAGGAAEYGYGGFTGAPGAAAPPAPPGGGYAAWQPPAAAGGAAGGAAAGVAATQEEFYELQARRLRGFEEHMERQRLQLAALQQMQEQLQQQQAADQLAGQQQEWQQQQQQQQQQQWAGAAGDAGAEQAGGAGPGAARAAGAAPQAEGGHRGHGAATAPRRPSLVAKEDVAAAVTEAHAAAAAARAAGAPPPADEPSSSDAPSSFGAASAGARDPASGGSLGRRRGGQVQFSLPAHARSGSGGAGAGGGIRSMPGSAPRGQAESFMPGASAWGSTSAVSVPALSGASGAAPAAAAAALAASAGIAAAAAAAAAGSATGGGLVGGSSGSYDDESCSDYTDGEDTGDGGDRGYGYAAHSGAARGAGASPGGYSSGDEGGTDDTGEEGSSLENEGAVGAGIASRAPPI